MGVIVKEEYVCDYCGKSINGSQVLVGKLSVRKQGARGLGKDFELALHVACSEKLTKNAPAARRPRKSRVS